MFVNNFQPASNNSSFTVLFSMYFLMSKPASIDIKLEWMPLTNIGQSESWFAREQPVQA